MSGPEAWSWLLQPTEGGPWRIEGPDGTGLLHVQRKLSPDRVVDVGARRGALDCDVAEGVGADQRRAVAVTRLGFVSWPETAGSRVHCTFDALPAGPPPGPYAPWLTDDGHAVLRCPDGRGFRVDSSNQSSGIEPADRVAVIASERLASWSTGDLRRGSAGVRIRDHDLDVDVTGAEMVIDGRFAWDHVLGLAGDVVATTNRLERLRSGGRLEPARDAQARERWDRRLKGRGRAHVDVGPHVIDVVPGGVRVDGNALDGPHGQVLDAFPVGDRIWMATPEGVWFLRTESRWVDRMAEEAGAGGRISTGMAEVFACNPSVTAGESLAIETLRRALPTGYRIASNCVLRLGGEKVREVDLVVLAPHGAYLIDVKSIQGEIVVEGDDWIFGGSRIDRPLGKLRGICREFQGQFDRAMRAVPIGERDLWIDAAVILTEPTVILRGLPDGDRARVVTLLDAAHFLMDTTRQDPHGRVRPPRPPRSGGW